MEKQGFNLDKIVKWSDIVKGVGEVVLHSIFRMPHQLASHGDHIPKDSPAHPDWVDVPNPIHLNKYEDGGYDDMGNYYDGDDVA